MRLVLVFFMFSVSFLLSGQQPLEVAQNFTGWKYYAGHSEEITKLEMLSPNLQRSISYHLDNILGQFADHLTFSHGQHIALEAYFRKAQSTVFPEYLVPAYDLSFILTYRRIGLKCYYLNLQLDQYGQLLKINWPRKDYLNPQKIISPSIVLNYAEKIAKSKLYDLTSYQVNCQYREDIDQLVWMFSFQTYLSSNESATRQVIEIPWTSLTLSREYVIEAYDHE